MSTNNLMTQERLDAIQARTNAAQNTPWQRGEDEPTPSNDDYMSTVHSHNGDPVGYCPDCGVHSYYSVQIADLIAHAPQDLTALLAEVERLRALTTMDDAMVKRVTHGIAAHWHDMHTNESLGRQQALAIAALEAAFSTGGDA